ncbi:MAG: hypothetical protein OXH68_10330 [Gammaproteobacteria bacterium]|nr:hypothetical protein [Gammaproteobacteria bacterium]
MPQARNEGCERSPAAEAVLACKDELRGLEPEAGRIRKARGYAMPRIGVA